MLGQPAEPVRLRLSVQNCSSICAGGADGDDFGKRIFMKNLAPAISPPAGIGDHKPDNQAVLEWVQEIAALTEPENVFCCDGSEAENAFLLKQAQAHGVVTELNQQKVPGSYLHRSNPNDVARVEQFTFICTP